MQAHGYKPKRKSLEEVLRTTRKNEAKLIGFDEDPILVENDNDICIKLEKLSTHEPEESSLLLQDAKSAGTSFGYKSFIPSGTEENCMAGVNENYNGTKCKHEPVIQHYVVSSGLAEKSNPWQNSDMETLTTLGLFTGNWFKKREQYMNFPFYLFTVDLDSFLQKSTAHSPLQPKFRKKEKKKESSLT